MRALSIRAPWWWFILYAGKRVENRDWQAAPRFMLGETFLIHSSSWWSLPQFVDAFEAGKDMARPEDWERVRAMPRPLTPRMFKDGGGKIVGRARLVGAARNGHDATGWAIPGDIGLLLADVQPLVTPIPFKGALGFFDVPDALLVGAEWGPVQP